jgi:hypothetical protein
MRQLSHANLFLPFQDFWPNKSDFLDQDNLGMLHIKLKVLKSSFQKKTNKERLTINVNIIN